MSPREAEIVRRYKAGETQHAIARDYGVTKSRVSQIVRAAGCEDGNARRNRKLREYWQSISPERAREILNKAGEMGRHKKPLTWPDCPDHLLADYRTLRGYYGAAEARRMLEGRA